MGIRFSTVIGLVSGVLLSLAVAERCTAQRRTPNTDVVGGFGKLIWGDTVEQARAVYRDLYFGKYIIENSGREPTRIYFRRNETGEIDGVVFDSIEYWFRENRFQEIRAVMLSGIGPRTLITRSEESFARLQQVLVRKYGRPTKYNENYFADFVTVTRIARWDLTDAAIILTYKGPEGSNEDQLIFELRGGGGH